MSRDSDLTERGRAFPRGLVLGFTMAEIAILIIFVLLLVLAALLARERAERDAAVEKLDDYEEIDRILEQENLPAEPDELRYVLVERVEVHQDATRWRELVREVETYSKEPSVAEIVTRVQESEIGRMSPAEIEELLAASREVAAADAHAELEEALEEARVSATPGEIRSMAEAVREGERLGMSAEEVRDAIENRAVWTEAVDERGRSAEPDELRDLLDAVRAAAEQGLSPGQVADAVEAQKDFAEALDSEGDQATEEAVKEVIHDARRWREMGGEEESALKDRLEQALHERDWEREKAERLQSHIRSLGSGTDHPSCWYQDDGIATAYLFDIALTPRGLVVDFAATSPEYVLSASGDRLGPAEEARGFLPLGSVSRQQLVSPEEFLLQTKRVHDWSRDGDPECRFFVRVFDRTAENEKQLYKDLLQAVEQHFYKLLMKSTGLPRGLARAL